MTDHDATLNTTREGTDLAQAWTRTRAAVTEAQRALDRARTDAANAEMKLANWLKPADAKFGEKFCYWYGGDLIQLTVGGVDLSVDALDGDRAIEPDRVTIRPRGK